MTQTTRIRLNRSEPDRISPGAAVLLLLALFGGLLKVFLPRWGLPWEYLYLMLGTAAVIVLDSIRAAIADRGRPMAAPWTGSNVVSQQIPLGKGQIGPVSSQDQKSEEKQSRIVDLYQELERHGGAVMRLWPNPQKSAGASSIGP